MHKLQIAIIGLGGIGSRHADCITQSENATVCGGVDTNPQQADTFSKRFNAPTFTDPDALLERIGTIDGVVVATPPVGREIIISKLLKHGAPILCEKPLSHDLPSATRIAEMAKSMPGSSISVGYCHRFLDATTIAARFIQEGKLGKLVWMNIVFSSFSPEMQERWNTDKSISGGGAAIDNACHAIDLYRHLIEKDIQIEGFLRTSWEGRGDDSFCLSAKAKNGALGQIRGSYLDITRSNIWEIAGEMGSLQYSYSNGGKELIFLMPDGKQEILPTKPAGLRFQDQMNSWLKQISGTPSDTLATLEDGLAVCDIIEHIK